MTGARKLRLAAVVTILLLMPLFINQINHLLYMVSYDNSVNLFTNLLSSVGSAAFMFFIAPHVLSGKQAKIWGIVATILLGLLLVVDLFDSVWQFRGIESGDYYLYSDIQCSTTYCVINTLRNLLTIAFFALLAIGCDKRYRLGLMVLAETVYSRAFLPQTEPPFVWRHVPLRAGEQPQLHRMGLPAVSKSLAARQESAQEIGIGGGANKR